MVENQVENAVELVEAPEEVVEAVVDQVDQRKNDNLVAMRKRMEDSERRATQAEKALEDRNKWKSEDEVKEFTPEELPADPFDIDDDEYLQAKHYKVASKKTEEKLKRLEQTISMLQAEKATEKLPDFNSVVTNDNLKVFASLYPHDYKSLMSNPDFDSRSVSAYNMIIRYGIADVKTEMKNNETIRAVEKKILANSARPGSSAMGHSSASPLANASKYDADGRLNLTEEDAKRIQMDMRRKIGNM
jgi:hypothetical protein